MDCCCGTATSGLGGLRFGCKIIIMNDQDGELVDAAQARALQYFLYLTRNGILLANGERLGLRASELENANIHAMALYVDEMKAKPIDNYPRTFVSSKNHLEQLCERYNVYVDHSTLKLEQSAPKGLFSKNGFKEGDPIVPCIGRFGYDKRAAQKSKSTSVWHLESLGEGKDEPVYLTGSLHAPATYINDGSHAAAEGVEGVGVNVEVLEENSYALSDAKRLQYYATSRYQIR